MESSSDLVHAIQLSLAPVFLLTAIAGMLNVMTGRLARIMERGRFLADYDTGDDVELQTRIAGELAALERRRHLSGRAITASTLSALLVCTVIAALFGEELVGVRLRALEGVLFMSSTTALVVGLAYFLREVHLATLTVKIRSHRSRPSVPAPAVSTTHPGAGAGTGAGPPSPGG